MLVGLMPSNQFVKRAGRFLNEGLKKFLGNLAKSVPQSLASNAFTNLTKDVIDWIRAFDPVWSYYVVRNPCVVSYFFLANRTIYLDPMDLVMLTLLLQIHYSI